MGNVHELVRLEEILKDLNVDVVSVVKDYLFTEILAKIADFKAEIEAFEKKYGKSFEEVQRDYLAGEENFEVYDDLMAWEFAIEGMRYWKKKLRELQSVLAGFRKVQRDNQRLSDQEL